MSGDLHTVFCAECTSNFDWKSVGVFYTHRLIGMPGKITRLLACTEQQRKAYPKRGLEMGPTFIHPNYVNNPRNGESSGSYNKPAAVMHWVSEAQIDETYILFIDADMLLRAPIDPVALGASRGMVVSEHVGYLDQGIRNHLVENFVPEPSMAGLARAAGWYHIFHIDDLRTIAPRWLHYTEVMRTNPQRYWDMNNSKGTWNPAARRAVGNGNHIPTGDAYVEFGEAREQRRALTHVQPSSAWHPLLHARPTLPLPIVLARTQAPWISEMYGYIFAAAEAGVDTKLLHGVVQYTDFTKAAMPPDGPSIIHYGLHCHVGSYHFTKYHCERDTVGARDSALSPPSRASYPPPGTHALAAAPPLPPPLDRQALLTASGGCRPSQTKTSTLARARCSSSGLLPNRRHDKRSVQRQSTPSTTRSADFTAHTAQGQRSCRAKLTRQMSRRRSAPTTMRIAPLLPRQASATRPRAPSAARRAPIAAATRTPIA